MAYKDKSDKCTCNIYMYIQNQIKNQLRNISAYKERSIWLFDDVPNPRLYICVFLLLIHLVPLIWLNVNVKQNIEVKAISL